MKKTFQDFIDFKSLNEASQYSRYSIETNYRTKFEEVIDAFSKLCLGYVSSGLKNCGYHCKTVFKVKPFRVLVASRDWDHGEWICAVTFNEEKKCFVISEGNYNKPNKTISIEKSKLSDCTCAADLVKEVREIMERLKRTAPVKSPEYKIKIKKPKSNIKIKRSF